MQLDLFNKIHQITEQNVMDIKAHKIQYTRPANR
jgi:hypothetical protein